MNTVKLITATYFVIKKESVIIIKIQITTTFFKECFHISESRSHRGLLYTYILKKKYIFHYSFFLYYKTDLYVKIEERIYAKNNLKGSLQKHKKSFSTRTVKCICHRCLKNMATK